VKQVVILAGGKGTRLSERLGGLPKPLIDVCGTPLLERQVLLAKQHGFSNVLILVNHAAEKIVDFCTSKNNWGLAVHCLDDGQPRGTAGATLAAYDHLHDEFLVMYGDTMLQVDLSRFHDFHNLAPDAAATLFLHPNDHPHDSDLVELDDQGFITRFHPYPHDPGHYYPNLVNAALYWVRKGHLSPWRNDQRHFDFAKHLFPEMIDRGARLRGYNSPEYIKDIGTPKRLDKVCADFQSGKIGRASLEFPQPVVFLDRDGTINEEVNHLNHPDQLHLLPGSGEAIRRLNASIYRCCIVTNQPVIARGECSLDTLQVIHNKLETLLGQQGAFVDRIYFCPHHPDKGFPGERPELKIDCDCRKPNTGMIEQAAKDFNLDRGRSWFIGDSSVDIEAARRSGIRSILVETGHAGLDHRHWAAANATVPDLAAAVSFILDRHPRILARCNTLSKTINAGDIVLVGGHSRAGKSTFAGVLQEALHARGLRSVLLSADRWLKNHADRTAGVLGRFDMAGLQSAIDALSIPENRPEALQLNAYNKARREIAESTGTVSITPGDIIIVEGVVALALDTPDAPGTHRFHLELDEALRKQRVIGEYILRGSTEAEALEIYCSRLKDEYPEIERIAGTAIRITLPT